jgi:hypothetical protein
MESRNAYGSELRSWSLFNANLPNLIGNFSSRRGWIYFSVLKEYIRNYNTINMACRAGDT